MVYYQTLSLLIFGFPLSNKYHLRSVSAPVIKTAFSSFIDTFCTSCINEWNVTVEIRNSKSVSALKKLMKCEKKKTHYSVSMIHLALNSLARAIDTRGGGGGGCALVSLVAFSTAKFFYVKLE